MNQGKLGGCMNPPVSKEFGIRVSPVDGGFLINKFDEGLAACTSIDEARKIVMAYFDQISVETPESPMPMEEPIQEAGVEIPETILTKDEAAKRVEISDLPELKDQTVDGKIEEVIV